jgi:hypothetical protein
MPEEMVAPRVASLLGFFGFSHSDFLNQNNKLSDSFITSSAISLLLFTVKNNLFQTFSTEAAMTSIHNHLREIVRMNTARQPTLPNHPKVARTRRSGDTESCATVTPITIHPNHPIHLDQALVARVLQGNPIAIRRLETRVKPYVENFASDPFWADYTVAFQRGMDLISRDHYASLRRWNPQVRSLSQHIDYLLRFELREEMAQRRTMVRHSLDLIAAIKASVNDLSDTHYWLLSKILIDGIRPKRLMSMMSLCPDLRLTSIGSIGSTYSRALRRLLVVCPIEYQSTVAEFIHTRQRSGRYR